MASNGFENEAKNIFEEYEKNGLQSNHELVSESMVNELCIAGTPGECKTQLRQFRETGIDLPIIQFNQQITWKIHLIWLLQHFRRNLIEKSCSSWIWEYKIHKG